jgi:hypothetical protein
VSNCKEAIMSEQELGTPAGLAIITLAEIKASTESFEAGQANVFDALDAIMFAIEAYRCASGVRRDAA